MESLGINWKILIGQIVNFAILFYLLKRFAFKPFLSMLEKRKTRIEEGVRRSEEIEKRFQQLRELSQKIENEGQGRARQIVIDSEIRAKAIAEEIIDRAEEEKKKIIAETRVLLGEEREAEKERQKKEAANMAVFLAERFLKEKFDEVKDKKFIEELLRGLK